MGSSVHEYLDQFKDTLPLIGVGAIGAGADCLAQMRDRRSKLKWWDYPITFFMGTAIGFMFGYIAKLAGAPDYGYIAAASMGAYLNKRLVEFLWMQFKTTIKSRLHKDDKA